MSSNPKGRPASPAKERFWRAHVESWQKSGMSMSQYCRSHGLSRDTFVYRRNKLIREKAGAPGSQFALVPFDTIAEVKQTISGASIRVLVGERFRIEVTDDFSAPVLAKLVRTLEQIR